MEQTVLEQLDEDVTLVNDDDPLPPAREPANLLVHFGRYGSRAHSGTGRNIASDYGVNAGTPYYG